MKKMTLEFERDKVTDARVRFKERSGVVGPIYVDKAWPDVRTTGLRVTIEETERDGSKGNGHE